MKIKFLLLITALLLFPSTAILHAEELDYDVAKKIINGNNEFGFKLLNVLQTQGENTVISPTSIAMAFSMLQNGAVDEVRDEINKIFGWQNFNDSMRNYSAQYLLKELNSEDKNAVTAIANSLWIENQFKVKQEFIHTNKTFLNAEINRLPFNKEAIEKINDWVSLKTNKKIPKIIETLNADDVMMLINAIYFNGKWNSPFDAADTQKDNFYLADNTKIQVPMMTKNGYLDYADTDDYQAVRLFFGKGDVQMTFILPKNSLADFQKNIDTEKFNKIQKSFETQEIKLFLPRFKIEYSVSLSEPLKLLGMKKAFEFSSGFTKISDENQLKISQVVHKTFLEVKEEGAEAAAVTAILLAEASEDFQPKKIPVLKIDRPFFCAITNIKTGNILFAGAINNPTK